MLSTEDLQLGRLALAQGFLDAEALGRATELAAREEASLETVLLAHGFLDEAQLAELVRRRQVGDPDAHPPEPTLPSVSYRLSEHHGVSASVRLSSVGEGEPTAGGAGQPEAPPVPGTSRYEVWGEVARGGMGRIYLALDRDINRRVAMKVMRAATRADAARVRRFVEEIQATGQLEHPNVVPIYDMGLTQDQQPYFTMRYVKGQSLEDILDALAEGREELRREYGRVRLLSILYQICLAVHFANEKGVVHRDLKPGNIMVGSYGEALIMDWGLAKVQGRQDPLVQPSQVDLAGEAQPGVTLDGQIIGTPSYMSPEQASGHSAEVDRRSDVYGLGGILYAILTFHDPVEGDSTGEILDQVLAGGIIPPRERAPLQQIPEALEEICLHALALIPEDRHPTAKALADDINAFLEGHRERERNHILAEQHFQEGMKLAVRYHQVRNTLADLERTLEEERHGVQLWWPFERRHRVWEASAALEQAREELAESFSKATERCSHALDFEPLHAGARRALADLYMDRFRQAEEDGNRADQIMYRRLVERFQDGQYDELLKGDGRLTLSTRPSGVEVFVTPQVEEGHRYVDGAQTHVGTSPLRRYTLPMGSYLLTLVAPGYHRTTLPVRLARAGEVSHTVRLFTEAEVGAEFIHIPAGPVPLGGDDQATSRRPRLIPDLPDFFLARYPVTVEEYAAYLEALLREGALEEAAARVPRESSEGGPYWVVGKRSRLELPTGEEIRSRWEPRWPISSVSWHDAMAYATWLGQQQGRCVSLPHEDDWEKAARGADERRFPWGNLHDYTFANNAHSHAGGGRIVPVGTFPVDRSPYGVMDMAGNVRELCRNSPAPRYRDAAVIRGGGYSSPGADVRAAGVAMLPKREVRRLVGFRVAVYPDGLPAGEEEA